MTPGSTSREDGWDREGKETSEEWAVKPFTTVGNWTSFPDGEIEAQRDHATCPSLQSYHHEDGIQAYTVPMGSPAPNLYVMIQLIRAAGLWGVATGYVMLGIRRSWFHYFPDKWVIVWSLQTLNPYMWNLKARCEDSQYYCQKHKHMEGPKSINLKFFVIHSN